MAGRLASLLPRFVALPLIALLATATLTFAADQKLAQPQTSPAAPTASVPSVVVVPDVRRQAFVFAKGTLEDARFAWKVVGPVQGYAANLVAAQNPAPGTRVVDTGAPTIQLTLAANRQYRQEGSPENASPYPGSAIRIAGGAPAVEAEPEAEPPAPVAKPKPKPKAKAKLATAKRPAAFTVAGAPNEPLDEMPLPARAQLLAKYVATHPRPTNAAVNHFLYQHSWIVTGAEFGWWRGAQALEQLIEVDRRAQRAWGIGTKSEALARATLERVRARSK
jgi:hypothetical protein